MEIPIHVRLRLELACLQYLADTASVRILHVKGEALHPLLRIGRRPSTDCDVLVHPADVDAYLTALETAGWEQHATFRHGSIFGHAATYYHPRWGTVDVHRHFPGLDDDPTVTFETFWETRDEVLIGGIPATVPDLLSQRVILLAHAARDAMGRSELDRRNAWDSADDETRAQVDALASRLGARVPICIATGRAAEIEGEKNFRIWTAMFEHANPTEVWRARIADAEPGLPKLRILLEAMKPNPDHLANRLGHKPTKEELRQEWWVRWGRGARRLWAMARKKRR